MFLSNPWSFFRAVFTKKIRKSPVFDGFILYLTCDIQFRHGGRLSGPTLRKTVQKGTFSLPPPLGGNTWGKTRRAWKVESTIFRYWDNSPLSLAQSSRSRPERRRKKHTLAKHNSPFARLRLATAYNNRIAALRGMPRLDA